MKIQYIEKSFTAESLKRIEIAEGIIEEYQRAGFVLTLRQLFYQFVARGLLENTERSYNNLKATLSDARLAGLIDWETIEDRTRNLESNSHWKNPGHILKVCAEQFEIDKWFSQPLRIEVWIEKEALAGVIADVCKENDVPYFSCRGYNSQSEMWRAGRRILDYIKARQEVLILYFGDHDPSGLDMDRDIYDRLKMFTQNRINIKRLALTMDQIDRYSPPPNPTKVTDSRAPGYFAMFGAESWELDALEPGVIVGLIEHEILSNRDDFIWAKSKKREKDYKDLLKKFSNDWRDGL